MADAEHRHASRPPSLWRTWHQTHRQNMPSRTPKGCSTCARRPVLPKPLTRPEPAPSVPELGHKDAQTTVGGSIRTPRGCLNAASVRPPYAKPKKPTTEVTMPPNISIAHPLPLSMSLWSISDSLTFIPDVARSFVWAQARNGNTGGETTPAAKRFSSRRLRHSMRRL